MKRCVDQRPIEILSFDERSGDDAGVGRAALNELQRLLYVFAVHQPRLNGGPQSRRLQRLLCGKTVRRVRRIGDGDSPNARSGKIFQGVQSERTRLQSDQREASAGVDRFRVGEHYRILLEIVPGHQIVDGGFVRRKKHVGGRAVSNLLAQDAGRSRHEHHVGMSDALELGNQLAKGRAEIGRGKNRQSWGRRLGPGCGGRKKGRDEGQPHESMSAI